MEAGTIVRLQCPCGLVTAHVSADGAVRFESVPAFAHASATTRLWRRNSLDSRPPTTASNVCSLGGGQNRGETARITARNSG